MARAAHNGFLSGAALWLALGCGGRVLQVGEGPGGNVAGTSGALEGGAPSIGAGGAAGAPSSAAGAPSAGAPSAGAGTASGGASPQNRCLTTIDAPNGKPRPTMDGVYNVVACGQATPCTMVGEPDSTETLPDSLQLTVAQSPNDLSRGTVTLYGTGQILLDGRPLDATFSGHSFEVELSGPISPVCSQEYDLSFQYDFDGVGPRKLDLDFERSPTCSGNAGGVYCKGSVHGALGDASLE